MVLFLHKYKQIGKFPNLRYCTFNILIIYKEDQKKFL